VRGLLHYLPETEAVEGNTQWGCVTGKKWRPLAAPRRTSTVTHTIVQSEAHLAITQQVGSNGGLMSYPSLAPAHGPEPGAL